MAEESMMVRDYPTASSHEEVKEPNSLTCLYVIQVKRAELIPLPGSPTTSFWDKRSTPSKAALSTA